LNQENHYLLFDEKMLFLLEVSIMRSSKMKAFIMNVKIEINNWLRIH